MCNLVPSKFVVRFVGVPGKCVDSEILQASAGSSIIAAYEGRKEAARFNGYALVLSPPNQLPFYEPTLPSTERVWRLRDRLSEAEMDAVVANYYGGASVAQLTRRYGINHWSVNKLIRERGHRFRQDNSEDVTGAT